jgi:hypothetical protein
VTLPAPGDGNPFDLIPPGTPNAALVGTGLAWDTYAEFVSGALTAAYNDLITIQFLGNTNGRSPGPGSFA